MNKFTSTCTIHHIFRSHITFDCKNMRAASLRIFNPHLQFLGEKSCKYIKSVPSKTKLYVKKIHYHKKRQDMRETISNLPACRLKGLYRSPNRFSSTWYEKIIADLCFFSFIQQRRMKALKQTAQNGTNRNRLKV